MRILTTFFLAIISLHTHAQIKPVPQELKWLLGSWNRTGNDSTVKGVETWVETHSVWKGTAFVVKNRDTIITEKIRLAFVGNNLEYIADVAGNHRQVSFKVISYSITGFICENPDHDFPKKIEYTLNGNKLIVTISGDDQKVEFNFYKASY